MKTELTPILIHEIKYRIYTVRDRQVMFDIDLAKLYGVTTSNLNKAVARNIDRFPNDFIFEANKSLPLHRVRHRFALCSTQESSRYLGTHPNHGAFVDLCKNETVVFETLNTRIAELEKKLNPILLTLNRRTTSTSETAPRTVLRKAFVQQKSSHDLDMIALRSGLSKKKSS